MLALQVCGEFAVTSLRDLLQTWLVSLTDSCSSSHSLAASLKFVARLQKANNKRAITNQNAVYFYSIRLVCLNQVSIIILLQVFKFRIKVMCSLGMSVRVGIGTYTSQSHGLPVCWNISYDWVSAQRQHSEIGHL